MTQLDDEMLPVAEELLEEFGKKASLEVLSVSYDPITAVGTATKKAYSVKIAPPASVENKEIDGKTIVAGDMKTAIAASAIEFCPCVGDELVFDSSRYRITIQKPVYSGELIALHELTIRTVEK